MRFVLILILLNVAACTTNLEEAPLPELMPEPGLGVHGILMSAGECLAAGGSVIGDIGDGRVHRPDYICANGSTPLGTITYKDGKPVATEGAVCCGL